MDTELRKIKKLFKQYPNAHIHYFSNHMWSMYPNKEIFEEYWQNGDGDQDLSEIELMEGNDFDSDYIPMVVKAIIEESGKTASSI